MNKNTKSKKLLYFCISVICTITFLSTFNITTSRYIGQVESNDNIIAVPILTLSNNTMSYSINNMIPGNEQSYEFYVSNVENGKINEVLLDYYFNIQIGTEIPLIAEIYDITQGETKLELTNGKTANIRMNYGTETTKKYKLKIIWDKNDNDYQYVNKKVVCNITLEAQQVV